jgi:hypothetical protein
MQNKEELRQKGNDRSRKTMCRQGGKISFAEGGGGINIVFGPKYRPLSYKLGCTPVSVSRKNLFADSDPDNGKC